MILTVGRWVFLSTLLVILSGCNSAEEKIVDLSAGVFLVFVVLVLVKYISPRIVKLPIFTSFTQLIARHSVLVVRSLYLLSALLIAAGFLLSGIYRVHIFSGFVVLVIASHVHSLVNSESEEIKNRAIEVISLGLGVLFALTSLWFFGVDLFKGL